MGLRGIRQNRAARHGSCIVIHSMRADRFWLADVFNFEDFKSCFLRAMSSRIIM